MVVRGNQCASAKNSSHRTLNSSIGRPETTLERICEVALKGLQRRLHRVGPIFRIYNIEWVYPCDPSDDKDHALHQFHADYAFYSIE